jgi:hypothetical protein
MSEFRPRFLRERSASQISPKNRAQFPRQSPTFGNPLPHGPWVAPKTGARSPPAVPLLGSFGPLQPAKKPPCVVACDRVCKCLIYMILVPANRSIFDAGSIFHPDFALQAGGREGAWAWMGGVGPSDDVKYRSLLGVSPIAARRPERWAADGQENARRTPATQFATELGSTRWDENG